jgi:hypothetical protein
MLVQEVTALTLASWSPERLAGLAYIAPMVAVLATWYLLLFGPGLPGEQAGATLRSLLIDDAERHVFWWLALLPVACLAFARAYLAPAARAPRASAALAVAGVALALITWRWLDASLAFAVTVPLFAAVPGALWRLA